MRNRCAAVGDGAETLKATLYCVESLSHDPDGRLIPASSVLLSLYKPLVATLRDKDEVNA